MKFPSGKQREVTMTNRYSELTLCKWQPEITSTNPTTIPLYNWILPYDITNYELIDNGPHIVRKFFTLWVFSGVKKVRTTAYHSQANSQVERYNRLLVARSRHYDFEHGNDWDTYVERLN